MEDFNWVRRVIGNIASRVVHEVQAMVGDEVPDRVVNCDSLTKLVERHADDYLKEYHWRVVPFVRFEVYDFYISEFEDALRYHNTFRTASRQAVRAAFAECIMREVARETVLSDHDGWTPAFLAEYDDWVDEELPFVDEAFGSLVEANEKFLEARDEREEIVQVLSGLIGQF